MKPKLVRKPIKAWAVRDKKTKQICISTRGAVAIYKGKRVANKCDWLFVNPVYITPVLIVPLNKTIKRKK